MAGEYLLNYKARKYYTGDGSQTDFLITFPGGNPIETSHVKVFVNGSELTSAWSVVGYGGNTYVRFDTAPNGATAGNVLIKRVTPDTEATRVVDFVGGSLLKAEDLDRAQLNCLYVSQESADLFLDQGGTAVNTTFDQSIAGVKTFTGTVKVDNAANMFFKPSTIPINLIGGIQYVLAAKASDGSVGWEETLLQRLPDNVVLTDGPTAGQEILTPKKFSGSVEFGNAVKITVGAASAKVLTSDGAGNASWAKVVNGVRLGSSTAAIKDGIVTITAADIGVLGGVEVDAFGVSQVTGPVDFDGSISVGDAGLDNLTIHASMKIPANAGAGKVLTSNADGFCAWAVPTAYVTSVNNKNGAGAGGAVTLNADDVGAVSVGTTQSITGAKTFTGNMVIGATGGANTVDVLATLKYPVGLLTGGLQAGRILTSTVNGTAYWASPPALGVVEVNGQTGSVITLLPEDLGAVATSGNEDIGGVKTFVTAPIMKVGITINDTMKYAVGGFGVNKFLTSNASGDASWATVPASGIVSVNGDSGAATGGAISITADGLGAVSKTTAQDITGVKSFKASVNLGNNPDNQTIIIGAPLYYPINMGIGGAQEGQVLTSDASGKCVWQIPEAAGVSSLNGATGPLTISAASLGALTEATLPVCDATTLGAVKMGSGLFMSGNGVLNVQVGGAFPIATRYDAATPTIGGFMVGDNLTINATTGRLDAMTGTGATQVTSFANLTGAVTTSQILNTVGLASKAGGQQFTGSNSFTKTIKLYQTNTTGAGQTGGYGVNLWNDPTGGDTALRGLVSVQNQVSTNDVFRGYSSTAGITSHITGEGDAFFSGTVTATEGFVTPGGMSIGDNLIDGITLSGTLKIPAGAAAGYVLKCTADTDAITGALIGKAVWSNVTAAPVLSVNGITGIVVITADGENGLGAVTKSTTQTITGAKTFSAATTMSTDCTVGTSTSNILTVNAQLRLPSGAAVNKIWACNNATTGAGNWVNAPSGFVTSVNGHSPNSSGQVSVLASDIGAVTITGNQNIAGDKTFTGTVNLQGNVVVGTTETTNITISSAIKIATGAVAGKYLTCVDNTGACQWSDAAQAPVLSVNTRVGHVVITADSAGTGIGAVTKDTTQTITGAKTFSAVTSFTENMTLGDGLADIITISGTMKIAQDAVAGKVLTCGASGGTVAWQSPLIISVITKIGTTITATQTGEVIIDAGKIGAATTAQLDTATAAIATAQTTANNAATAAATAQSTADSKLAAVATTTTANPVGGTLLDCLLGNGTSGSPLKVLGALPIGGISSGDLTGSYPGPTIGAGKVTYAKMQSVAAQRLLGNATNAAASVTEIQLADGLTWVSGKLDTVNKGNAVLSATQTFTGANTFDTGLTTTAALSTTGAVIIGSTATASTLTVNATPTFMTDLTINTGKVLITPKFRMNTGVTDGYVLTTDGSGNGTWKAAAGGISQGSVGWSTNVFATFTTDGSSNITTALTTVANPYSSFTITTTAVAAATDLGVWFTLSPPAGTTWTICVVSAFTTYVLGTVSGTGGGAKLTTGITNNNTFKLAAPKGSSWSGTNPRPPSVCQAFTLHCVRTA